MSTIERLDDYGQCINWAEQAIYNLNDGFANREHNMEELLTALAVGHYVMGHPGEVEAILETPTMKEHPSARFGLLAYLAEAGDQSVLPRARRAMAEASEGLSFIEDVVGFDSGGIRSAEKLARLVSVGDKELMDTARKAAGNVMIKHRSTQFVRLYRSGDQKSLALVCESADAAYREDEMTGYDHNSWIATSNLHATLDRALENGKFEDAKEVTAHFKEEWDVTEALAKRYAAGDLSTLKELEERLPRQGELRRRCVKHLAKASYAPAVGEIRSHSQKLEKRFLRPAWRRALNSGDNYEDRYQLYEDLSILHGLGDETAIERVKRIASNDPDFHNAYGFGNEGPDVLELAKIAYTNDPSVLTRLRLLELDFSPELFKEQLVDEIGRLQESRFSWLGQLIVLTARKSKEHSITE